MGLFAFNVIHGAWKKGIFGKFGANVKVRETGIN